MDPAQDFAVRLRWWRIHCVAAVAIVAMICVGVIVQHSAVLIPLGLAIAIAAYAGVKADRSILPVDRGPFGTSDLDAFPDGRALDGPESAGLQILAVVGLGIAVYGVVDLVRAGVGQS